MKTYENMKHNIPEGATHYYHNGSSYGWVKKEVCATGRDKSFIWDLGKWVRGVVVSCAVKPIQQPTYRHEKVKLEFAWIAAKAHEERTAELWRKSDIGDAINGIHWKAIQSPSEAAQYHFDLYIRVEVTERDEFIEKARNALGCDLNNEGLGVLCKLYDAGCRFVNGKE